MLPSRVTFRDIALEECATCGNRVVPLGSPLRTIPSPSLFRDLCNPFGDYDRRTEKIARDDPSVTTSLRYLENAARQRQQRRRFGEWTRAEDQRALLLVARAGT